MYNHAPHNYHCPLCLASKGVENEHTMMKQADIFYRDEVFIAAISSKFVKNNPGHVIIFPIKHYENIYDLGQEESAKIISLAQKIAITVKKIRKCAGVTLLQNNEPASEQHAFHFHLHIFPRFANDNFSEYVHQAQLSDPTERIPYATDLRNYFNQTNP